MYAVDSLRQLAMKFLERDELANFSFQVGTPAHRAAAWRLVLLRTWSHCPILPRHEAWRLCCRGLHLALPCALHSSTSPERLPAPVCGGDAAQPRAGDPGAHHPLRQPDGAGARGQREERLEVHVHGAAAGAGAFAGAGGHGIGTLAKRGNAAGRAAFAGPTHCHVPSCCCDPLALRRVPWQVFTTAASDESPQIVRLAFDTVEKIVREHFHYITGG